MKTFLYPLLLLLLLTSMPTQATHLRGGYIYYTLDAENPRKAYFTMKLYTNRSSPADDPVVMIEMGDGIRLPVVRDNAKIIKPDVILSTYKWEHTFVAAGTFTATWIGENRNGGILNLAAPTDQLSMGIATDIMYNPLNLNRNSVQIKSEPHFTAYRGIPLRFNLLAYDPDGDSLGYELIAPLHADAQKLLQSSPGFTIPEGFAINRFGEVSWENPDKVGEYAFAVAITQYRKGRKIGYTIFDMQFLVRDNQQEPLEIKLENREELTFLNDGRLLVKPGEKVSLRLHFPYQADKTWLSELQELGLQDVSFHSISNFVTEFTFTATETLSRRQPYGINFNYNYRLYDSPASTTSIFTIPILIWQPQTPELILQETESLPLTPESLLNSKPGLASKLLFFAKNGLGYDTELTVESDLSKNAELFSFVTRDSADSKVGELIFKPSVDQVSSAPYTLTVRSASRQLRPVASGTESQELVLQVLVAASTPMSSGEVVDDAGVLVYPNPVEQMIQIRTPQPASTFTLYAADGRVVYRAQLVRGENLIQRPTRLRAGLYTYTVGDTEQLKARGKLLLR